MKVLGYIVSLLGVFVLVSSRIPKLSELISSFFKFIPKESFTKYLIYFGLALIFIGIFLLVVSIRSSSYSAPKEVPIYQGNKIVGYRRQ